ncbi:MAG TPA: hypothetical protein VJ859_00895 [Allosphingosinicella sp.]|nr:hypothetical protein [Allosphingosinicella sp.]
MNPFEILVLIIGIVLIVNLVKARRRSGEEPPDLRAQDPAKKALQAEIRALKERVAVLERIATDSGNRLEQEIERLRDK